MISRGTGLLLGGGIAAPTLKGDLNTGLSLFTPNRDAT